MKIAFVHYEIGESGGVSSVLRTNISSLLKKYKNLNITLVGSHQGDVILGPKGKVKHVDFPELGISKSNRVKYSKWDVFDYLEKGEEIYKKLSKILDKQDVVIIENPGIGIHPAATYGFYRFAKKNEEQRIKRKVIFRMHDFAEDRLGNFENILKFEGREHAPYWHKIVFPRRNNLGYFVINFPDRKKMLGEGIIDENKVQYLPNPIDETLLQKDMNISKQLKEYIIKKNKLEKNSKFIYYPVRVVERKNIEEAIFITQLINIKFKENYHLLLSLREADVKNKGYASKLEKFVKKNKLPVIVGLNDCVALQREYKGKKIVKWGVGDAYNISDKVITTSILEGFGMFFIESWYHGKSLIGRDLPHVTPDFKHHAVNLEHLYGALFIDKKDFKDLNMSEKCKMIVKLKNKKFFDKVFNDNKHQFEGMFRMFDKEQEIKLIEKNRTQVIKHFGSDHIAQKMMDAIKKVL